jgi:hypothetical protein
MLTRDRSVAGTAVIALAVAYSFAATAGIAPVAQPLLGVCLAVTWILGVAWLAPRLSDWSLRCRDRREFDRLVNESISEIEVLPAPLVSSRDRT